jgi:DNA-binding response OmpR family regulator
MTSILIIDDEEDIRDALKLILQHAGYSVKSAPDGRLGIELQRKDPAQLVITDIIMPDKDGVSTIRDIRREFPDVKIIAISGGGGVDPLMYKPDAITTSAYLAAAEDAGADRLFTKPFDRQGLLQAVGELLGYPH